MKLRKAQTATTLTPWNGRSTRLLSNQWQNTQPLMLSILWCFPNVIQTGVHFQAEGSCLLRRGGTNQKSGYGSGLTCGSQT